MPALTVVVETSLPATTREALPEYARPDLTLCFEGPGRNVEVDLSQTTEALGGDPPPRLRDLLEIAVAVYVADLAFLRGQNEGWVRSTHFLVPVRDPAFWRDHEPQLALALYVLTHDNYGFHFCARAEPDDVPASPCKFADVDCVSLLSGGIDSFAGAALLLATGRRPLFVGHRSQNPTIVASQDHVRQALTDAFGEPVQFVPVSCGPSRGRGGAGRPYPPPEERETSQRARSFLYLALGALGCQATGAGHLLCPENGVLAVNLPLTEARVGGYSTAGVRPQTLAAFRRLLDALGVPLTIDNPFLYQTKGQLIREILRRYFPPDVIQGAVSCWMTGRLSRPCGACIPCLVRAISMHAAGLPPEAHAVDPFSTGAPAGPESAARANLVDLLTLVGRLQRRSDPELLRAYPLLLELAPEAGLAGILQMLRRFAAEAQEALGEPAFG
ncbi:MAG: hypothetical protein FJX74_00610 [Armatimonadetes bacterium]|nr:hypothetical protein [Armatimonadota bacterium]